MMIALDASTMSPGATKLPVDECRFISSARQAVLIVEDQPDVREVIRGYILGPGLYSVDLAGSPKEALELFEPGKYFAVILDLHLGSSISEGISLAINFRKEDDNVFLAAVSGYYPVFDERLLQSVDDFLKKPIDYDFLLSNLSEILEEEIAIKEQLHDLMERAGYEGVTGD